MHGIFAGAIGVNVVDERQKPGLAADFEGPKRVARFGRSQMFAQHVQVVLPRNGPVKQRAPETDQHGR